MIKTLSLFLFILSSALSAKTYSLKELIALAKTHPEIKVEEFEIDKAKTLFNKIEGETGPKISLVAGIGPNRSVVGNPVASQTSSTIDTVTYLTEVELNWPIFMFNRSGDYKKAADGNFKVKKLDVEKKEALLIKRIKEYYFGFQYASSLNDFATSTLKDLDDVIADMKSAKNRKHSADDLAKISIFRSLAQSKKYEIEKGMAQGFLGLKFVTQESDPKIDQDWIEHTPRPLPELAGILNNLPTTNTDLQKVSIGLEAKEAFLKAEKKGRLPVIGLFSKYDWRETHKSTRQTSNFAYDPYNRSEFSIGLGLIWDIDFGVKDSKVTEAQIDLNATLAQKNFAEKNLPLMIEKTYLDLVEAQKKAEELEKTYKQSKKLFTNISSGVALGITPAKDIIDTYTLKAQVYKEFLEAVYNYEMKLAELSYEVGAELDSQLK
jgi:outer membrane protein TolC